MCIEAAKGYGATDPIDYHNGSIEEQVMEPTGVARLSGVLANVRKVAYSRIGVLPPATVVDEVPWREQRVRTQELFDDQVRSAGTVVVSKTGLDRSVL